MPPQVFTDALHEPGQRQSRRRCATTCARRDRLLKEAGWEIKGGKRVNAKGEPLTVEFLGYDPTTERYVLFYKPALERLGIGVSAARRRSRRNTRTGLRDFDFDIVTELWGQSLSPGNEQRDFWGSAAADRPGSRNSLGIKDPGDRRADREGDLRQGPRRTGRGDQGARPRAARPRLRRAAMDLSRHAHRALEPLRPARRTLPKYAAPAFPTIWWWDAELAREDRAARK